MGINVKKEKEALRDKDVFCKYNLKYNEDTGLYDCDKYVYVKDDLVADGKLILSFGTVKGTFDCSDNQLTTLKGAPKSVGGDFKCYNNQLTSLEGAPKSVGGAFYCKRNKLTTLEGAPKSVGGRFDCSCNQLTSLKGSPKSVGSRFYCTSNKFKFDDEHFYNHLPDIIGGDICADVGFNKEYAKQFYYND